MNNLHPGFRPLLPFEYPQTSISSEIKNMWFFDENAQTSANWLDLFIAFDTGVVTRQRLFAITESIAELQGEQDA